MGINSGFKGLNSYSEADRRDSLKGKDVPVQAIKAELQLRSFSTSTLDGTE